MIRGSTRVLAVVGHPVAHSLSPEMHNAAFAALGLDAVYVAVDVDPSALPHVLRGFEAVGIGGNITVPHKLQAANLLFRKTYLRKIWTEHQKGLRNRATELWLIMMLNLWFNNFAVAGGPSPPASAIASADPARPED